MFEKFEDLPPELQCEIVSRMSPLEQIKFERTSQNSKELVKLSFLRMKDLHIDNMPDNFGTADQPDEDDQTDEEDQADKPDFINIKRCISILRRCSIRLERFFFSTTGIRIDITVSPGMIDEIATRFHRLKNFNCSIDAKVSYIEKVGKDCRIDTLVLNDTIEPSSRLKTVFLNCSNSLLSLHWCPDKVDQLKVLYDCFVIDG